MTKRTEFGFGLEAGLKEALAWSRGEITLDTVTTIPFDAAAYIDTPEAEAHLLSDSFESGDAAYIAHAIGIVVRARGVAHVASEANLSRPAVYAAISGESDPKLSTLLRLFKALGVKVAVEPRAV